MRYICPICGYNELLELPYINGKSPSHEICNCCGFQYGYDDFDQGYTFESYRKQWIKRGFIWRNQEAKPIDWSLKRQLENIGACISDYECGDPICIVCGCNIVLEKITNEKLTANICPCCGYSGAFKVMHYSKIHEERRKEWIQSGYSWYDENMKPTDWNLHEQLKRLQA